MSLADFNPETISLRWYNILSFNLLQPSHTPSANLEAVELDGQEVNRSAGDVEADGQGSNRGAGRREESSDDSQASTLTKVPAMESEVAQCCDLLDTDVIPEVIIILRKTQII